MRAFACGTYRSTVFFEQSPWVTCNSPRAFDRERADLDELACVRPAVVFAPTSAHRSVGHDAPYPFVRTPKVLARPHFGHVAVGTTR